LQPVPTSHADIERAVASRQSLEELQERTGYAVAGEPSRADRLPPVLYPPERCVQRVVRAVGAPARRLQQQPLLGDLAAFARANNGRPLSSRNPRAGECTMGVLLCTALRHAAQADGALLNGGSIRGDRDYSEGVLTFADLMAGAAEDKGRGAPASPHARCLCGIRAAPHAQVGGRQPLEGGDGGSWGAANRVVRLRRPGRAAIPDALSRSQHRRAGRTCKKAS